MQVKILPFVASFFITACSRSYEPLDVPDGQLSAEALTGVWIIDSKSLDFLRSSLKYKTFTNATDHMVLLNDNATCAFRGFDVYTVQPACAPEFDAVNKMENTSNNPWPKAKPYDLCEISKEYPFLRGPYACETSTNFLTKNIAKTYYNRWQICKRQTDIDFEDFTQPFHWKYKIVLGRKGSESGYMANIYIGKDAHGIYLFVPVVLDDGPIYKGIKYRRVEASPSGKEAEKGSKAEKGS